MRNTNDVQTNYNLFVGMLPKDMTCDELVFLLNSMLGGRDLVLHLDLRVGKGDHNSAFVVMNSQASADYFYLLKKEFYVTRDQDGYGNPANRFYGSQDAFTQYICERNDTRTWHWLNFEKPKRLLEKEVAANIAAVQIAFMYPPTIVALMPVTLPQQPVPIDAPSRFLGIGRRDPYAAQVLQQGYIPSRTTL